MNKHTPGPWNVTRIAYDIARGIDSGVREVKAVRNGGYKRYIADVRSIDSQGIDNTEANAALIAAAPDMLEALHVIKSQSIGDDWTAEQALQFIKQRAQAAIDKAEGHAQ